MSTAFWSWWQNDDVPSLPELPSFHASDARNVDVLCRLTSLEAKEVSARLDGGHRVYVAWVGDVPVGYGWVATLAASIGELELSFGLAAADRYLWDFATLP